MKVLYNSAKALKHQLDPTYREWARCANLDLSKPFVCQGVVQAYGKNCYVVVRPDGKTSRVDENIFDPVIEELNMDQFL